MCDGCVFNTCMFHHKNYYFKRSLIIIRLQRTLLRSVHLDFLDSYLFNLHPIYMAQLRFPYLTKLHLQNTTLEFLYPSLSSIPFIPPIIISHSIIIIQHFIFNYLILLLLYAFMIKKTQDVHPSS